MIGRRIVLDFSIVGLETVRKRAHHIMKLFGEYGFTVYHLHPHIKSPENNLSLHVKESIDKNVYSCLVPFPPYWSFVSEHTSQAQIDPMYFDTIMNARALENCIPDNSEVIFWIDAPYWWSTVHALWTRLKSRGCKIVVMQDLFDDLKGFSDIAKFSTLLNILQENIDKITDVSFYTYSGLSSGKSGKLIYLPNAVDTSVFKASYDFTKIKRDRVIYFGVLADWFDFDVLVYLAIEGMEVNLYGVLSGLKQEEKEELEWFGVIFNDPISQDILSIRASYCSSSIMPFKINNLTHSTNPLKLYESYALGMPFVSTELKGVEEACSSMDDDIRPKLISEDRKDFWTDEVLTAASKDTVRLREKRRAWAEDNTWNHRFIDIKNCLMSFDISLD